MMILKLIARWARAYARAVSNDGVWVYAPPLVISASSPIWRAAPPPRIEEVIAVEVARPTVTDPKLVAARRAGFRLILNESKA
jgi:hypothetical protein